MPIEMSSSPFEARRCWIEANNGVASSLVLPIANWSGAQRITLSFFKLAVTWRGRPFRAVWAIRASTYCSGLVLFRVPFALKPEARGSTSPCCPVAVPGEAPSRLGPPGVFAAGTLRADWTW